MNRPRPPRWSGWPVGRLAAAVWLASGLAKRRGRRRLLPPLSALLAGWLVLGGLVGVTQAAFSGTTGNAANTATAATFPRCYGDAVLADSPAGYWRLDETSGTSAADAGSSPHAGTYRNGVSIGQPGALSESANKAVSLDGTNDDVQIGDFYDFAGTVSFSVEWWMKRSTTNQTLWQPVVIKEDMNVPGGRDGWGSWVVPQGDSAAGRVSFERWNGAASEGVTSSTRLQAGVWYHVAATYDGTTTRLYVNGTHERSAAMSLSLNNHAVPLYLGSLGSYSDPTWLSSYAGQLDDMAIYSSTLSASQIRAHYNAGRCYRDEPLADNPVGYWRLGEATGTSTAFDSKATNQGLYVNGPTLAQTGGLNLDADTAVGFDGVNDRADLGDVHGFTGTSPFTLEAWLKPGTPIDEYRRVIAKEGSNKAGWHLYLQATSFSTPNGIAFGRCDAAGACDAVGSGFGLQAGTWYHVAVTYDGANLRIYVNGTLTQTTASTRSVGSNTAPLRFGMSSSWTNADRYTGSMDEVAIYNGALSQARVQAHYLYGRSYHDTVLDRSPVAYWRLGEASGSSAADQKAANPGTYTNSPTLAQPGALAGDADTSVGFDGVDDYVSVPDAASLRPANITVEAWLKPATGSTDWASALMKTTPGTWGTGYGLYYRTAGTINFFVNGYTNGAVATTIPLNEWTHVVGTYDGATVRLYTNGVLAASLAYSTAISHATTPLRIGEMHENTGNPLYFWKGGIDDVALYSTALTATQVRLHYDSGRQ